MVPLIDLSQGDTAELLDMVSESAAQLSSFNRLRDIGLREGKQLTIIKKSNSGPILLEFDNIRVAIGHNIARQLRVNNRTFK